MHITYDLPVTIEDIQDARKRLAGKIYKTGMPRSNYLSERCKGEIFLKFENMQRTGSFKIRGAFNKLSSLTDAEKRKGVVACSAGNHAQGVSLSCAMLGIDGKVVMPMAHQNPRWPRRATTRRKWCCTVRTLTTPSPKSAKSSRWKGAFLSRLTMTPK